MSMPGLDSAPEVELLLFEVGGSTYGADASQVVRIDRMGEDAVRLAALGPLARGSRALVFQSPVGERRLAVDAVLGIQSVPVDSLRRLPPAAGSPSYAIGVWLDGEKPVLLLDLKETLKAQEG